MDYAKIGKIEAIALVCIGVVNHTVLNMPKNLLKATGSSSILNIIYLILMVLLLTFVLNKWSKLFGDSDIVDVSEYLGGKKFKILTGILYIIFFLIMCAIILRNFAQSIKLIYFPTASIVIILLAFVSIVAVASKFNIQSIVKSNLILVILVIASLVITFLALFPRFEYQRMFPLLGNGIDATFLSGLGNIYAFSGFCILFFLPPLLKEKKEFSKISIISMVLTSVLLLLSIISLLFALPFVFSVDELSPIYLLARASQIGSFLKRPESIFILIWILSILSFMCIFMMFSRIILQKLLKLKDHKGMNLWLVELLFLLALLPQNAAQIIRIESYFYKYFAIFLVFVFSMIVLFLAYRKKKKQLGKEEILDEK